tara:strand:+ start:477 stop:1682 length:1206 start_codon:yes stop_codon:yes gene_type:complete
MKINLLDLFSGIGGFHLGLSQAGFKINSYYSEIDKYAIKTYNYNFKNSTYVESVTNIQRDKLPKRINAITFGSPCQDFSLAGKRKGLDGDRSSLISEAINLISELKPDFFIWENVKGTFSSNNGEDFWAIIKAFTDIGGYRLEWQLLNTSWFLPQNRERIYLVGYAPNKSRGQVFPIGESFGKDDDKISLFGDTNKGGERGAIHNTNAIMSCLSATDYKQPKQIKVKSATKKGYEITTPGDSVNLSHPNSKTRNGRVGKKQAQTLDTSCNQAAIGGTFRTHKDGRGFRSIKSGNAPTIPSRAREDGSGQPVIKYITHNCLTEAIGRQGSSSEYLSSLDKINQSTGLIRRLTPIECERLQGFPDNWTLAEDNSDTQRYKMCGNAVTVDVVKAVGERIIKTLY